MKNFLELLATDHTLTAVVNREEFEFGLHDFLVFNAEDTVTVDGVEVLPKYKYLANNGVLTIAEPFYCWYHRISGQGWLLKPQ